MATERAERIRFMADNLKELAMVQDSYSSMAQALEIQQEVAPNWQDLAEAVIEYRAKILGVTGLEGIEDLYLKETAESYSAAMGIEIPEFWGAIDLVYLTDKDLLKGSELEMENLRQDLAKTLQLNKFIATWGKIAEEFVALGIMKP